MPARVAIALILLLIGHNLSAQIPSGSGTVNGVIRDSYGDGLPDARVEIVNASLGISRIVESTIDGTFDSGPLPPAYGYRLKVSRKEFIGWESFEFYVPAGKPVTFEVRLPEEADAQDGVKPTGRIIEEVDTGYPLFVMRPQLESLPIPFRRLDYLASLAPGLAMDPLTGRLLIHGQLLGYQFAIDGLATEVPAPESYQRPFVRASLDSASDLEVLTLSGAVQLGWYRGAMLNTGTRAGGNAFHGGFYEYFRNRGFTGVGRFALGHKLAGNQHVAGVSLAGPLAPNHLFFFANLEYQDRDAYSLNRILNPLISTPDGKAVDRTQCSASPAQCTAVASFIEPQMNALIHTPAASTAGVLRLDYSSGSAHHLNLIARDSSWRWPGGLRTEHVDPWGRSYQPASSRIRSRYYKLGWTATVTPFMVNEMALGVFRERYTSQSPTSRLATGPLSIVVAETTVGASQPYLSLLREIRRTQFGNHIRGTLWSHTIQVGFHISEDRHWFNGVTNGPGTYTYPTLTEFALDFPAATARNYMWFTQRLGMSNRNFDTREYGIYVQETWRPFRRMAIQGGLRWDRTRWPQPTESDPGFWHTGTIPIPNLAFSPKFGAAYQLDDRTVLRFGLGGFYGPVPMALIDTLLLGNARQQLGITVNPNQAGAPLFPAVIVGPGLIPGGTKELIYAAGKFFYPFNLQLSFTIDRQLLPGLNFEARYLTSPGKRLLIAKDVNLKETTLSRSYTILSATGATQGSFTTLVHTSRVTNTVSTVYEVGNAGGSSYNALILQLRKSLSRGFSALATYTWAHAIDDAGGPWIAPGVPVATYNDAPARDRGNSAADQRHRAVFMWNWEPSMSGSAPRWLRLLADGWQHSAIVTLSSALPATPLVIVRGQQFSGVTMPYTRTLNGSAGWHRVPFLPVNSLRGESDYCVNLRLSRSFSIYERVRIKAAVEAFNVFDSQRGIQLNPVAYVATSGTLRPAPGFGQPIAAPAPRSAQLMLRADF